jgi:hypothetical protein
VAPAKAANRTSNVAGRSAGDETSDATQVGSAALLLGMAFDAVATAPTRSSRKATEYVLLARLIIN